MTTVFEFVNWLFFGVGVAIVLAGWGITAIVDRFASGSQREGRTFKWGFGIGVTIIGIAMMPMGVLVNSRHSEFIPLVFGVAMVGGLVAIGATLYVLVVELLGDLSD